MSDVVIVGAGQAGLQVAASLRNAGHRGTVRLVGDEAVPPYHRPPLSKAFLKERGSTDKLLIRPPSFFANHNVSTHFGEKVVSIDCIQKQIAFENKASLSYDWLILATGSRNRELLVPGTSLSNVFYLRTIEDAMKLRETLVVAIRIVIIGGGFLGLEAAVSAQAMGAQVTILEAGDRLMPRTVSRPTSDFFLQAHRANGIETHLNMTVTEIAGESGFADAVVTADGSIFPADLVLISIGVVPNSELAEKAGLEVRDGIVVDDHLRTADKTIFAIGDCARFQSTTGEFVRIESVPNAVDQAKNVASTIVGRASPYQCVPWFWSDQGHRLQMAGTGFGQGEAIVRGSGTSFSVDCYQDGALTGVESINCPADHITARRRLALSTQPN